MRRVIIPCVLCILLASSLPAAAQTTEWRFALRLSALDMNAETAPILATGTSVIADGARPTFSFEGQYMIANAWAAVFSAAPARFDLDGSGGDLDDQTLAKMWFAPVTLTIRYELQLMSDFQPYVGAGVNVGFLFAGTVDESLEAYGVEHLSSNVALGFAAEIGLNYRMNRKTFATIDVKYMGLDIKTTLEGANNEDLERVRLEGSPWQVGLGLGWRF